MSLPVTQVVIFDKGGRVQWRHKETPCDLSTINSAISTVLEEKGQRCTVGNARLEWRHADDRILMVESPLHMGFEASETLEKLKSATTHEARLRALRAPVKEKPVKKPKSWHKKKLTAAEIAALDHSKDSGPENMQRYLPDEGEAAAWDEEEVVKPWSFFRELSFDSIEPVMAKLKDRLVAKNVAAEIAGEITSSVASSLVGKKALMRSSVIRENLIAAIERILTPKRSTDVLREVLAARKPYVIVFCGINGVGKSTTLSKVAYYLKSHGVSILIAACDTFRSGAVEQLRSHATCLNVDLFERGYLKDPADVAKNAIDDAKKRRIDCVLVDTAGRMQNNDKLMRELAKLVNVNNPNLVLFVGEALVGNDGIDQLNMFNQSLAKFSPDKRGIDGIVLTKYDCIDDKVGATLSMTYKTGQPIIFVGVGQKYTHLKKLSVPSVINALFS